MLVCVYIDTATLLSQYIKPPWEFFKVHLSQDQQTTGSFTVVTGLSSGTFDQVKGSQIRACKLWEMDTKAWMRFSFNQLYRSYYTHLQQSSIAREAIFLVYPATQPPPTHPPTWIIAHKKIL